jgi:hypothetical protein
MADDPLTKFAGKLGLKQPTASSKPPSSPDRLAEMEAVGREAYEAFDNKVRPVCLELRCNRTGLSYSLPYAHLGAIVFNFRTGGEMLFTGCGLAVTIKGRNLGEIARALRLHTCAIVEDYSPEHAIQPQPVDAKAPFIESITVDVPRGMPSLAGK